MGLFAEHWRISNSVHVVGANYAYVSFGGARRCSCVWLRFGRFRCAAVQKPATTGPNSSSVGMLADISHTTRQRRWTRRQASPSRRSRFAAGFAGGGQAGYNYQFAPNWLAGIEATSRERTQSASTCAGIGCANFGGFYFTEDQKLRWFATLRARLGYATGDWLFYVTGGGAWAESHNDFRVFTPIDAIGSAEFNLSGWAIGGGVERHLVGGWSAKLEYLYPDLGNYTDVVPDPLSGHTFTMTSNVRDNVVRVGLNYKFNDRSIARYKADSVARAMS